MVPARRRRRARRRSLQDSADLFRGMGLPVRFSHLFVDGKAADGVLLSDGNRVRSQPGSP